MKRVAANKLRQCISECQLQRGRIRAVMFVDPWHPECHPCIKPIVANSLDGPIWQISYIGMTICRDLGCAGSVVVMRTGGTVMPSIDPGKAGLLYFVGPGKLAPLFFFNETILVEVLHVDNEIPAVIACGWDDQSVTPQVVKRVRDRLHQLQPITVGLRARPLSTNGPTIMYDRDQSSRVWHPGLLQFGLLESSLQAEGHQSTCALSTATHGRFEDPNRTPKVVPLHTPGQQAGVPCLALDTHDRDSIAKPFRE